MNASLNTLQRVLVGCLSCLALWAPATAAAPPPESLTLTSPATGTARVGELVNYHFVVPVPQGTTASIAVTLQLPAQLVFVQGLNFAVSGTMTCGNQTCTLPAPTLAGGRNITWTINSIIDNDGNTADFFAWDMQAVVDNVTASVEGASFTSSVSSTTTAAATTTAGATSVALRIVEPLMTLATTVAPTTGDATDIFTVTATLTNSASTGNGADAQTVVASFNMPSGLEALAGTYVAGTCPAPASTNINTSAATATFNTITLGSTPCTFSFNVEMLGNVSPGQVINTPGQLTWHSLPGLVTELSNYSSTSNMRTGSTLDSGGSLNSYIATSNFALTVNPLALAVTLQTTSAAVAGTVNYIVSVTIPQGTTSQLTLVDVLPNGLSFVSDSDLSASQDLAKLTCGGVPCVMPSPTVNGQVVTWFFGDVVNSDTSNAAPETLTFTMHDVVANVSQAVAGAQLANTISIQGTGISTTAAQRVTVLEPSLSFTQATTVSSSPNAPQAGDTLTTTVTVTNAIGPNSATAYDTNVVYTMPAGGQLLPISGAPGTCGFLSSSLTQTTASFTLSPISSATGSNTCSFSFVTKVTTAAAPNETETAIFAATWTSANGAVVGERTGNPSDPGGALNTYSKTGANFSVVTAVPAVAITNNTLTSPVGGTVTSHVTVTIPQGTTPTIVINASLPAGAAGSPGVAGYVFKQGGGFSASANVTCGGVACTLPAPVVSNGGHSVQWTFTNVVDTDTTDATQESLQFDILGVVENSATSVAGATVTVSASYTVGSSTGTATAPSFSVVEPRLNFTVSSAPATAAANDIVTVTVEITNPIAAQGSTAYETTPTFTLPNGKMTAVAGSYRQLSCPAATPTLAGTNASFVFAPIAPGTDCTFSFQVELTTGVNQSEVETATGVATWTSQPGNLTTSQSAYAADATERTGNAGNIGGALNNYLVSGLSFSVSVPPSSFSFTGPLSPTAPVGSAVVYHASAVIPQGTTAELDVTVNLPPGLVFQQGTNFLATAGISCNGAACALPGPAVTNSGYTAEWVLRNLVNSNSTDTGKDTVSFDVVAIVENQSGAIAGATFVTSADFATTNSASAHIVADAVTIVEPQVVVTDSSTPDTAAGNDVVTVTVNLVNPASDFQSTAYNVVTTFALPQGKLVPVQAGYVRGSCPLATQTLTTSYVQFAFASLAANSNCSFSFQVRLTANVNQQETEFSPGSVTWTSQPEAVSAPQSPYQGDSVERTGNQNDIGGPLNVYAASGFGFWVNTPASTFQYTGPAAPTAPVGGAVVFHASTTLPHGTTPELDVAVSFSAGLAFQKTQNLTLSSGVTCGGVPCVLPAPTVSTDGTGTTVYWTLTNIVDVNAGSATTDTLEWDVVGIVEDNANSVAGATFSSVGSFDVPSSQLNVVHKLVTATIGAGQVTVVEPALTVTNSSTPALAAANDLVTVTVKIVNPTSQFAATAYDTVVNYALPAGKLIAAPGSYAQGTCPLATPTLSGSTASFTFAPIAVGTTCTFSFQAQLSTGVNPLENEVATGVATWTSLPGDVTQSQSQYYTDATERTGNPNDPGDVLNDYIQTGLGFSVSTRGSSFTFTGPVPAKAAVGAFVTYHASAVIPQGTTPALSAQIVLPHGLVFASLANLAATAGITCNGSACALPQPTVSQDGYTVSVNFTNIVDPNSADTLADSLGFDILTVVENTASSVGGSTYVAQATIAAGANSATLTAPALTVIEPRVTFTTNASPGVAGANDAVTVLVNISNPVSATSADAYNATATYTLATGKETAVVGSYLPGTCPTAIASSLQGTSASFTFAKIAQGTVCQFAFQVRLTTGVLQSEVETATAVGTWTSQPATVAVRESGYGANDSSERTGSVSDPGGALNNYRQTNFGFAITVPASSFIFAGPSVPNASIGQVVLYHAGASIPQATLNDLMLTVNLPPGLVFQKATDVSISPGISCGGLTCTLPNPTVTNSGHTIAWELTNIVDSNSTDTTDSIEWDVATVVENSQINVAGAQAVASGVFTTDITSPQSFTTPALVIVEPRPVFAIVGTPTPTSSGSTTTVTVSVKNPLVANGADAYNVNVTFTFPSTEGTVIAGSYQAGTCPTATPTVNGNTATFDFATIPLTEDCTFSFGIELGNGAAPNTTVTASSRATWTSRPGTTNDTQSLYVSDAFMRTGNPSDPGGALNNYSSTDFDLSVAVPPSYFNGGVGSSGGGCSGTGPSDLAWIGLLAGLAFLARKRRSEERAV